MNPHGPAGGQDRGEGPASSSSQQGSASSSTPTKEERTPRPPNAWILYRSFKSQELKDQQELEFGPQRSKPRSQAEVSRIVSAMWKSERPEVRQQFELIAKERKRQHQESFPGYRYRPRRPPRTGAPQRASSSRKSDPARDYSGESGASSSMHPSSPSGEGSDPVLQSPSLYERGDPGLCSSMLASTDSQGDALGRFDTLAGHGFSDKDLNVSPAHATQASLALATDMSGALAQHGKPHAGFGLVNDHRQPNPFRPLPRAGSGSQQFRADTTTGDPSSALASLSDDGWSRFAHTSASSSSAVATTTSGTALLYQDMRTADSLLRSSSNPSRIQRHDSFTNPPQGAMPMNTFDHFVQFERITSPERETDLRRSPHFYLPPHGSDSDAMASFVPHFPAVQSHGTGREQSWQPQPQSHSTFSSSPPQQSRFASIVLSPPAQQRAKPTFPGDLGASSLASEHQHPVYWQSTASRSAPRPPSHAEEPANVAIARTPSDHTVPDRGSASASVATHRTLDPWAAVHAQAHLHSLETDPALLNDPSCPISMVADNFPQRFELYGAFTREELLDRLNAQSGQHPPR